MAAESHTLVHDVDMGITIKDTLGELLNQEIGMNDYVYSRTIYIFVTNNSITANRCLKINVYALGKSYPKKEMKHIGYISGKEKNANAVLEKIISN